jgi:hypothetical protein
VRDVMIAGRWVVLDREPVHVDRHELAHHARREAARLWHRLDGLPEHPFAPKGGRRCRTTAV